MDQPRVSFRTYFRRASSWMLVLFLLFLAIMGPMAWFESRDAAQLARDGVETVGTVTDKSEETRRNSNGSRSHNYYLTISYQAQDGSTHSDRRSVGRALYFSTPMGAAQPVRYSASQPDVAEAVAGETASSANVMTTIAVVLLLAALGFGWFMQRGVNAQRRAAAAAPQMVPVLAHHQVGKKTMKTFTVEWSDGATRRRTSAIKESALPPVGSDIAIYTDPKSGKSWWAGEF